MPTDPLPGMFSALDLAPATEPGSCAEQSELQPNREFPKLSYEVHSQPWMCAVHWGRCADCHGWSLVLALFSGSVA